MGETKYCRDRIRDHSITLSFLFSVYETFDNAKLDSNVNSRFSLRLPEDTFISMRNLRDSHKLSSFFFEIQVIHNACMVVCFDSCMNIWYVCVHYKGIGF